MVKKFGEDDKPKPKIERKSLFSPDAKPQADAKSVLGKRVFAKDEDALTDQADVYRALLGDKHPDIAPLVGDIVEAYELSMLNPTRTNIDAYHGAIDKLLAVEDGARTGLGLIVATLIYSLKNTRGRGQSKPFNF